MTKQERHKVYEQLLNAMRKGPSVDFGLCYYIANETDYGFNKGLYTGFVLYCMEDDLPELYNMQPAEWYNDDLWFPPTPAGWKKRIALVEKCIELTK